MNDAHAWAEQATLQELVNKVIWESVMGGTAHCGWTDNARDMLVKNVQDSVRWAIEKKTSMREGGAE